MYEKEITEELRRQVAVGISQSNIARKMGVSPQTVSRIVGGRMPLKDASIDLLKRVFPKCTIHLHGDPIQSIVTTNQSGGENAIHNGSSSGGECEI